MFVIKRINHDKEVFNMVKKFLFRIIVIYIIIIILFINNNCISIQNSENIVNVIVQDDSITAFNQNGEISWIKDIETEINVKEIKDLNSDGSNEVIIGTGSEGKYPGFLFVYDSNGSLILYLETGSTHVYGRSKIYRIMDLIINDFDNDNNCEIIINSNNDPWYPNRIIITNIAGELIGDYWHPGTVCSMIVADYQNDGKYEIICGGLNNDWPENYECPCFFILDPFNSYGQAPPYKGNEIKGTELLYVTINKSEYFPDSCSIQFIKQTGNTIEFSLSDGRFCYYTLDNMEFQNFAYGDSFIRHRNTIQQEIQNEKERFQTDLFISIIFLFLGAIIGIIIEEIYKRSINQLPKKKEKRNNVRIRKKNKNAVNKKTKNK
jgi:hypothetical protein